jgi:hypothetical protein
MKNKKKKTKERKENLGKTLTFITLVVSLHALQLFFVGFLLHISKTKLPKNVKQPDSYEVDFLLYG